MNDPIREALALLDEVVANTNARARRLTEAKEILRAALAAPAAPRESTLPYEQALYELINKIDTGLDTGDILADARRASAALDGILAAGDLVANAHDHFKQAGVLADHYEQSVDFRIGWNACLDAIAHARRAAPAAPFDWRELAHRLYVELFHCDQQMCSTRDEDGDPTWTTGATVRDVLRDANAALKAAPAVQAAPTIKESLQVAAPQAGEDAREAKQRILDAAQWWADQRDVGPRPAKEAWTALAMRIDAELAMLTEGGAPRPAAQAAPAVPTKPGVYAWSAGTCNALVLVNRRPSAHSPGGVLNGHVMDSTKFYDGRPVEKWGCAGRWLLLHEFEAALTTQGESRG